MKRAIRDHWRDFVAIVGLLVIAAGVSGYILNQQRFRFPIIEDKPKRIYAELENAQAVTPGQGQTVEIAGVKIGLIANVELVDGRARVGLDIEREYEDVVRTDASGLLRPRTGLKDMFIQLDPGTGPVADEGFVIPVRRTLTDIDLDEILSVLDADVRDQLQLLLAGTARGLDGRGMDLAELFRRFGPTTRSLARVNRAVALEREGLKDAIHGLAELSDELAGKDDDLARLVDSSAAVFEALASEDRNVSATIEKLPEALRTTTATLGDVERFAQELGPASTELTPVFQSLEETNEVITPIARNLTPILSNRIRPFVREARPLTQNLSEAARGVSRAVPDLTGAMLRVNRLFNLLAFNPEGREDASVATRQEGYLFWLAWLTHNTANLINVDDANGPMRPIFLTGTCQTLTNLVEEEPPLEFLLGLTGVLVDLCQNPQTRSLEPDRMRKQVKREGKVLDRVEREARRLLGGGAG